MKTTRLSVTIPIDVSEAIDKIVEEFPKHTNGVRVPKSQVVTSLLSLALSVITENKEAQDKEEKDNYGC